MFKTKQLNQSFIAIDWFVFFLRMGLGILIFINHGIEKVFNFSHMLEIFPDPIHIGKFPSLIFALITDSICSILIIFGFFTRISTLLLSINLLVAFFLFHKADLTDVHGELAAIYLIITLLLFFYGSGKISMDEIVNKKYGDN